MGIKKRPTTFRGKTAATCGLEEVLLIVLLYKTLGYWTAYTDENLIDYVYDALCKLTSKTVNVYPWSAAHGLGVPQSGREEELTTIGFDYTGYVIIVGG